MPMIFRIIIIPGQIIMLTAVEISMVRTVVSMFCERQIKAIELKTVMMGILIQTVRKGKHS